MNILNDEELTEETQKEINSILEKRNQNHNRYDMIYDHYTKNQADKNINEKEIETLKEGLCQ
ncbi:hypothetical protein BFL38_14495 [Brachyspira hampsonii]|uniref:Uncharacterized protein n=1 Tax=Brachyspira hampsonii TaxID=1287055 RepID=A0A1E5NH57_9SPIR|nr:hypothetical protein [Brachyspira hampsonii]OEJ15492.1 hypothetical protein BFL38_14495 [Brachyspira hampsonii]